MKNILPRGNWLLVEPAEKESNTTNQGLIIPETEEREQKAIGKVLAIGDKIDDIKVGDEVIYGAFAGENIKRNEDNGEKEYKLLMDEDIIAFLK